MPRDVLTLDSIAEARRVITELTASYEIRSETDDEVCVRYHDTFDWRLYRAGLTLQSRGRLYRLLRLDDGSAMAAARLPEGDVPRLAADFPGGDLRDALVSHIKVRALLLLVTVVRRRIGLRLVDPQRQISAQLTLDEYTVVRRKGRRPLELRLNLDYERKHRRHWKRLRKRWRTRRLKHPERSLFDAALAVAGLAPGTYTGDFAVRLDPDLAAGEAVRHIARHTLAILRRNEAGIRQDIDTEFLHQFRVAVRRTRTLLTLLPKCVPAEELVAAKRRFGELGRRTGPLRDLDVLLLSEASYTAAVVPDLQAGLKRFFDMVRRRRDAASREVGDFVGTKTYRRSIEDWLRALQEAAWSGETCTGQANRPVAEVADRLIAKRLKRVLRSGKNIDATSPDAELHALRLHCKKLRYALEFFADLYEPKVMRKMIRQVKDFQEILGEFSDLSVHLSLLRTWLTEADDDTTDGPEDRDRVAAVGALIQSLSHRQGVLRRRFHDAFERFAGTDPVRML